MREAHSPFLVFVLLISAQISSVRPVYEAPEEFVSFTRDILDGKSAGGGGGFQREVTGERREDLARSGPDFESNDIGDVDNEVPASARPYKTPGEWATPAPDSGIDLSFTPVQTYLQVRRTSTVKRLPRSEAYKEAASEDEILNAHRLKEVLRTKKIQEVYSEEGYEDSAYDHGNQERHAEHDEGFSKHKAGKYKVKDPVQHLYDAADSESQIVEKTNKPGKNKPKVSRERVETSSMKVKYMNEQGDSKAARKEGKTQSRGSRKYKRAPKVGGKVIKETDLPVVKRDFAPQKDDFWRFPSSFEDLSVNKWGANFEPISRRREKEEVVSPAGPARVRIPPLPSFGYIHSLTDAHYGSQAPMVHHQPKPIPSHVINLTETFRPSPKTKYPGFEPKRLSKRVKRTAKEEEEGKRDTEEYEKELSQNLDEREKNIIGNTLKNLGISEDISEIFPVLTTPRPALKNISPWSSWAGFDQEKYPYYNAKGVDPYSPLRYASHPREFPKKSGYGMEFYDSRDRAMQCDPISVSLDDTPKENSTRHQSQQPGSKKRIVALGDKIRCLKIKYFGEDPLDSPFFKEDELKNQATTARLDEGLKYHSSYEYQPNKTMDVFVKEKLNDSNVEGSQDRAKYQAPPHYHPAPQQEEKAKQVYQNPAPDEETVKYQSHAQQLQRVRYPPHQKQNEPYNETNDLRVIPVREGYPDITTAAPIMGMKPPPMRYRPFPLSVLRLPRIPKPAKLMKTIKFNQNCLQPVTKMTISERADAGEDIMFECQDITLIQTTRDGNPHFQIIPRAPKKKTRRSDLADMLLEESADVRAGEVIESDSLIHVRRKRTPTSTRRKSQLFPNKSLLDKLIKNPAPEKPKNITRNLSFVDLGEKSPEELTQIFSVRKTEAQKKPSTTSTTTTTTPSTTTVQGAIKFEPKPLPRLSGRDFLVRYHKTRGSKNRKQPSKDEFWKVTSTVRPSIATPKPADDEAPKNEQRWQKPTTVEPIVSSLRSKPLLRGQTKSEDRSYRQASDEAQPEERHSKTKRAEPGPTPVLLYIIDQSTGHGEWVSSEATTEETIAPTTKKASDRQIKKQNARKTFFSKKLKKNFEDK